MRTQQGIHVVLVGTLGLLSVSAAPRLANAQARELLKVTFENRSRPPTARQMQALIPGSQILLRGAAKQYDSDGFFLLKADQVLYLSVPAGQKLAPLSKRLDPYGIKVDGLSSIRGHDAHVLAVDVTVRGRVLGQPISETVLVPVTQMLKDPASVTNPKKMIERYASPSLKDLVGRVGLQRGQVLLRTSGRVEGTRLQLPLGLRLDSMRQAIRNAGSARSR